VYASQRFETFLSSGERCGFFLGDGAGIGKGRQIAGLVYENALRGREKAVWFSVNQDLREDAARDFSDIGFDPSNLFRLSDIPNNAKVKALRGVLFSTYALLVSKQQGRKKKGRYEQLVEWLGDPREFEGLLIFDESHKAKNLSHTFEKVVAIQAQFPLARVIYVSATGASNPEHMRYMARLGLWGEGTGFADAKSFAAEMNSPAAMECVAMDLKSRGMYIARTLSYAGAEFTIQEADLPEGFAQLQKECADVWMRLHQCISASRDVWGNRNKKRGGRGGGGGGAGAGSKQGRGPMANFWNMNLRFWKSFLVSAKVPEVVRLAKEAIANGMCVVIGLQSTGEAALSRQVQSRVPPPPPPPLTLTLKLTVGVGVWSLEFWFGVWSLVFGVWSLVFGVWSLGWCLVLVFGVGAWRWSWR
jgi:hypothetical protein